MWLKTQSRGYVNTALLLSIGLGKDAAGRTIVAATLPAGQAIATAALLGPYLSDAAGEQRAAAALERVVARVARAGTGEKWDPVEVA